MTDYHLEYQKGPERCGSVFSEFESFFKQLPPSQDILDLGCGQGRDALIAARLGHKVTAVDTAESGLKQLQQQSEDEGLRITTVLHDITTYSPFSSFDVVVLDRVLHMLVDSQLIDQMLKQVDAWVRTGSYVMIADTKKNKNQIWSFFERKKWEVNLEKGNILIVRN